MEMLKNMDTDHAETLANEALRLEAAGETDRAAEYKTLARAYGWVFPEDKSDKADEEAANG